ncbi:MAG: helix-turn-helix domain-containing protein [Desulfitobacteriaceae bacterium]
MRLYVSNFNSMIYQAIDNFNFYNTPQVTLIYGPPGLGKTTMLNLLYQRMRKNRISAELVNARAFAREYAFAVQQNFLISFRERFRSPKLLLIDDLQLLEGKPKTLVELFYTYEHIIQREGKMVISLTADFPALDFLGKGLASRFLGGLVLTVKQPLNEEMEEFINYYLDKRRLIMEREAVQYLASLVCNLQMVISSIEKFVEFAESRQVALTLKYFQEFWSKLEDTNSHKLEPANVIRVTAEVMGTTVEELLGVKRNPKIAEARQLAIYTIRFLCQNSYPEIGRSFSRGHAAIIYACQQMDKKLILDNALKQRFEAIVRVFR